MWYIIFTNTGQLQFMNSGGLLESLWIQKGNEERLQGAGY